MTSSIDPTLPLDGIPAVKQDLRTNLGYAKSEIEALQALQVEYTLAPNNGTTDARAALASPSSTKGIWLLPGTYRVASNLTLTLPVYFDLGAKLKPDNGVTITINGGYAAGDWQHVFDISAGGIVIGSVGRDGYLTPQHWGALANGANDDSPAIYAACSFANLALIRDDYSGTLPVGFPVPTLPGGAGYYRLGSTVYIHRSIEIFGLGPLLDRYNASVMLRPVDGLLAAVAFISGGSTNNNTDYEPGNPPHSDEWKVYETNTSTGFVNLYVCKLAHTSSSTNRPGQGASWTTYWTQYPSGPSGVLIGNATLHADAWASGVFYNTVPGMGFVGGANESIVRKLSFQPVTTGAVRFGVVHNCTMHFEHCSANYFEQAGFCGRGQTTSGYAPWANLLADTGHSNSPADFVRNYSGVTGIVGSANSSTYYACRASSQTKGHGFICEGNNAGTVTYHGCDASGNAGAGFCDNSSIGSYFSFCHTAQNTWKVFNPATGGYYMPIKGHTATTDSEPGVGVNWRTYWTIVGTTLKDVDWVVGTFYYPAGAVNISQGLLSHAQIFGHYSEGGIEVGIVPRGQTLMVGGSAAGLARVVDHEEFATARVICGGGQPDMNALAFEGITDPFGTPKAFGVWLGLNDSDGGRYAGNLLHFGDARETGAGTDEIKLAYSTFSKTYVFTKSDVGKPVLAFSGADFTKDGYLGSGHLVAPAGVILGDNTANFNNLVMIRSVEASSLATAQTALNGQVVVRGQRWYFTQVSAAGKEGVVCTTAGTVGTTAVLKAFGAIDA